MSWRVIGKLWFNFRDTSLFGVSSGWLYFTFEGLNLLLKALERSFTQGWICVSSDVLDTVLFLAESSHCFQQDYTSGIRLLCKHWMLPQANMAKVSSSSECLLNDRESESIESDWYTATGSRLFDLVPFRPVPSKKGLKGTLEAATSSSPSSVTGMHQWALTRSCESRPVGSAWTWLTVLQVALWRAAVALPLVSLQAGLKRCSSSAVLFLVVAFGLEFGSASSHPATVCTTGAALGSVSLQSEEVYCRDKSLTCCPFIPFLLCPFPLQNSDL